jgi:nuclear transport factor 2 (NTF2) superfamily protein
MSEVTDLTLELRYFILKLTEHYDLMGVISELKQLQNYNDFDPTVSGQQLATILLRNQKHSHDRALIMAINGITVSTDMAASKYFAEIIEDAGGWLQVADRENWSQEYRAIFAKRVSMVNDWARNQLKGET